MIDNDVKQKIYKHVRELDFKTRIERGVVYTPLSIVSYINSKIVSELSPNNTNFTFLDLSCGTGVFLIDMLYRLKEKTEMSFKTIIENCLYGFDIDKEAIEKAKKIMQDIAGVPVNCNLFHGSSLDKDFVSEKLSNRKVQAVVGNPPYVKIQNMSQEDKDSLKLYNFVSGNTDLYVVFYELGLELLEENGMLGYVSSNTYLKNKSGRVLCEYLLDNNLIWELVDFKDVQIFENFSTYACVCLLKKSINKSYVYMEPNEQLTNFSSDKNDYIVSCKDYNQTSVENIAISSENTKIINCIENSGSKLIDLFYIKIGLATLADKVFFIGNPTKEEESCFCFNDIKIEKSILRKCVKASVVKTKNDIDNHGYIIFPYIIDENRKACLIDENVMSENFPEAYRYLSCNKEMLQRRDKGKNDKYKWYEYGRTQGLNSLWGERLLLAPLSKQPIFVHCEYKDMLYISGYGLFPKNNYDLNIAKLILESCIMELYIDKKSKKMRAGYNVYSKEFIKNFSIPSLTSGEKLFMNSCNKQQLDEFLELKYGLKK